MQDLEKVKSWIKTADLATIKATVNSWIKSKMALLHPAGLVGIDIGATTIKLIELSKLGVGHYRVDRCISIPLSKGAVLEKDIKEPEVISKALKVAGSEAHFYTKHAAIAVPDSSVITKIIQLDAVLRSTEIENQILLEADRHIPYPVEEISLDFQVLGVSAKNPEWVDVLLVASHKDNVEARTAAINAGGFQVKVVEVESHIVERVSPLLLKHLPSEGSGQTIAIVDIGATTLMLTVLHDKVAVFTRSESFGGQQLTQTMQQRYGLDYAAAEKAKLEGGLPDDYKDEVLEPFKESIVLQIRRALQFFYSTSQYGEIQHMFLAGGTALFLDLPALVTERLGVSTTLANPFADMTFAPSLDAEMLNRLGPTYLLSCGLAMRGFE